MKGKLIVGILITVLIFGCSNPFFPEKDEKGNKTAPSAPVITGHPQGAAYVVGGTAAPLTVTANKSGNGKLSYKWYSNDLNNNQGGTVIPGWTAASYTPSTAEKSTTYYYAVVTNTLNGKSASTASDTARIIVDDDIEPLDGNAEITGTYKIGEELSVNTTGITGAEAPFKYQWRQDEEDIPGATEETYTIIGANVAKVISCVITHNAAPGSVTADGEKVPYTIEILKSIVMDDNESTEELGDTITAAPDTGHEGDVITIAFTVVDICHYNLLDFGGVTPHIDSFNSDGSDTRIYTVNPDDASVGVINIFATFKHTNLVPDSIAFTDEDHVTGIYGDVITNAIKAGHLGSGAITYSSDNEEIAVVDNYGTVTLRKAGTAIITAHKDADAFYSSALDRYTLTVAPKPVTATMLTVEFREYDGTTQGYLTDTDDIIINGVINDDEVWIWGGQAIFADKNAGTGIAVSFTGWTLTGKDAGNYTLAQQPEDVTADIFPRPISIGTGIPSRTLIPFNSGDTLYGTTAVVSIDLTHIYLGLVAGDTVTVNVGTNSYGISGSANTGASGSITITYNGTTSVTQTTALSVPLTVTGNSNYTVSGGLPSIIGNIYILDGVTTARAIPVTQNNITEFNTYANTAAGLTRHYKLTQNVTLTPPAEGGSNWTAIGTSWSNTFRGSFNGQRYTITNLTINSTAGTQGMFGTIGNGSVIENIGLIGGSRSGVSCIGGIAGSVGIGGTVQNCYFTGNINCENESGGIVGYNGGMVRNCYFTGNIYAAGEYNGGIVGFNNGTLQNCYSTGNIFGDSSYSHYCGGVVGANEEGIMQNCYAIGNVYALSGGGVAGYNARTMRNCVALNQNIYISNNSANNNSAPIGRVSGMNGGTNNYARSTGMTLRYNWNGTTGTTYTPSVGISGKDGANVSVPFTSTTWWATAGNWSAADGAFAWDFVNVWEWRYANNSYMPILRNMPQGTQSPGVPIAVTGISLNAASLSLNLNRDTFTLVATIAPADATNKTVTWSSSNSSVATVTQSGLVTTRSIGTTVITATTADGGFRRDCNVTVIAYIPITSMSLSPSAFYGLNSDISLSIIKTPANATEKVVWGSSNESIVYIDNVSSATSARIETGWQSGRAVITVSTDDGRLSARCKIWVCEWDFSRLPTNYAATATFTMGSPSSETNSNSNERPQRQVTLSAFNIQRYPVTQELYEWVMDTNPSHFSEDNDRAPAAGETAGRRPVENVSWYDALVFCNRFSTMIGFSPAYRINGSTNPNDWGAVPTSANPTWDAVTIVSGSNGFRLPTEAQWEYACRAGTTTAYHTGISINDNTGWYTANSGSMTHEVRKKTGNAWGIFDMHGNVREWCWDWHGTYPGTNETNPTGAASGSYRVVRGGAWLSIAQDLRSAFRDSAVPFSRSNSIGFRIVYP